MGKKLLSSFISLSATGVEASIMINNVPELEYRDFAENKGKYRPGVTGTQVYRTDGTLPPDFSVSDRLGIATRVGADIRLTLALYLGAEVGLRGGDTIRQQRQAALNLRYRW